MLQYATKELKHLQLSRNVRIFPFNPPPQRCFFLSPRLTFSITNNEWESTSRKCNKHDSTVSQLLLLLIVACALKIYHIISVFKPAVALCA